MRTLFILAATLIAIIACLVLIVAVAMHRLRASDREADQAWTAREKVTVAPATAPTTHPRVPIAPTAPPTEARLPEPILLLGIDAKVRGQNLWNSEGYIANWKDMQAVVEWPIIAIAGTYDLQLTYALGVGPRPVTVQIGEQTINGTVATTRKWDTFVTTSFGNVTLPAGQMLLKVRAGPDAILSDGLMRLRTVCLVPPGKIAPKPGADTITLSAANAELHGDRIRRSDDAEPKIVNWISKSDWADWSIKTPFHQTYRASITFSNAETTGGDFDLIVGKETLHCRAGSTGDFNAPRTVPLGTLSIPPGRSTVQVLPVGQFNHALMNLWKLELTPQ